MKPYYADETVTLYHGDCRDVLPTLADASVDAVVTDPPYGLEFMGKKWDATGVAFDPATWRLVASVLKPGGHLLAFGGTRTWHRLACAIEDAGFEVRDSIAWLYGSGFPKSLDVSKAIDQAADAEREIIGRKADPRYQYAFNGTAASPMGNVDPRRERSDHGDLTMPATSEAKRWQGWGTALKPAFEPVVVARKPLVGSVAANVLAHGTGALNVDECRVRGDEPPSEERGDHHPSPAPLCKGAAATRVKPSQSSGQSTGRWPANVVLDESQAAALDRQSGTTVSKSGGVAGWQDQYVGGKYTPIDRTGHDDQGGASRFFYVAKADSAERPRVNGTAHPTVKPLALMRWLVRLVTPPGGLVLDPFAGSGTTLDAARLEGFRAIGVEREPDYLPLILQRLQQGVLDFEATP